MASKKKKKKVVKKKVRYQCGNCGKRGHNARTCGG